MFFDVFFVVICCYINNIKKLLNRFRKKVLFFDRHKIFFKKKYIAGFQSKHDFFFLQKFQNDQIENMIIELLIFGDFKFLQKKYIK
tara:strand:- start:130 stop:387 length:258 start_codon:yes stop_codon:yes gene_type:complete